MPEDNSETPKKRESFIERDGKEFITFFTKTVNAEYPGWIEKHKDANFDIISIGFGSGTEFGPLHEEFTNAFLWGFDKGDITIAQDYIEIAIGEAAPIKLSTVDAGEESSYTKKDGSQITADLITIRSPDIKPPLGNNDDPNWTGVLNQAWQHLNSDGVLFITLNHEVELESMKKLLNKMGVAKFREVKNPNAHKDSVFKEIFILIVQKP